MEHLLSVTEAAQVLGISKHTLNGWVSQRKVRHVKVGRRTMFRPSDLEEFVGANIIEPHNGDRRQGGPR